MDAEADIWSSPDPSNDGHARSSVDLFASAAVASSSTEPKSRPTSRLYEDDISSLDAGWGAPTPSADTTIQDGILDQTKTASPSQTDGQPGELQRQQLEALSLSQEPKHLVSSSKDGSEQPDGALPLPELERDEEDKSPVASSSKLLTPADDMDGFHDAEDGDDDEPDDFADFDEPATAQTSIPMANNDDDFGDFGDFPDDDDAAAGGISFGDEDDDAFGAVQENAAAQELPEPILATSDWPSFTLARQNSESITAQIQEILSAPLYEGGPSHPFGAGTHSELGTEGIRQVEGVGQILVASSSREAYEVLNNPPPLQPLSWLHSRTRRDLHIALGIPINLDELETSHSKGSGSRLPPLALTLEPDFHSKNQNGAGPSSAPAERAGVRRSTSGVGLNAAARSAAATSSGSGLGRSTSMSQSAGKSPLRSDSADRRQERIREKRREELGLGPMPEVDMKRVEQICNLTEDQLSLLPLPSLQAHLSEMESLAISISHLLTHHLTLREALQADSEMYNGLIKDLVTGAANRIGGGGKGDGKKGIGGVGTTGSGRGSPRPQSPFGTVRR